MARAAGQTAISLAILGGLLLVRCTGARDPLNSRIEALEKRVAELEQTNPTSVEPEQDSGASIPDASVASGPGDAAAVAPEAGFLQSCENAARFACEQRSPEPMQPRQHLQPQPTPPRKRFQPHDQDAALVWHHRFRPDSAEGQRCLREERERCESDIRFNREQRELYEKREQQYFRWLDGQLSPDRIDAKLSAKVEAKTMEALRRAGEAAPLVKVRCVLEFCRVDLDVDPRRGELRRAGYQGVDWQLEGSTAREDPDNPRRYSIYLARPGWLMPPWPSLTQRGWGGWFPSRDAG
jgi:hypothetical protein